MPPLRVGADASVLLTCLPVLVLTWGEGEPEPDDAVPLVRRVPVPGCRPAAPVQKLQVPPRLSQNEPVEGPPGDQDSPYFSLRASGIAAAVF